MLRNEPFTSADISRQMALFWNPGHWVAPLARFAKSSGLSITAYDCQGQRRVDPITTTALGKLLVSTGHWSLEGMGSRFERALALRCIDSGQTETVYFDDSLLLSAVPARARGEVIGVFVVGWIFDRPVDPMECDRLTRQLGLLKNTLWFTARDQQPVTSDRYQTYLDLLDTLTTSITNQLVSVEDLLEANRVKDEFLAAVSHELRTPLTSMKLRMDLFRRQKSLDPKIAASMEVIARGIETQSRLVDDLLDASRMITGKLRMDNSKIDILEIVRSAVEIVQPCAQTKRIIIDTDLPLQATTLIGDGVRIQQILWNLISNAVKFTPSGGRIGVRLAELPDEIAIEVKDSGCGIDPEFLPYIFDPFSQSRSTLQASRKGLGLGLAIAKYIVGMHGGTIGAESDGPGRGSTFRLTLPKWRTQLPKEDENEPIPVFRRGLFERGSGHLKVGMH